MANKAVKKRIFGREQPDLREQLTGFQRSAGRVGAMGDVQGRYYVGRSYDGGDVSAWRSLSGTLDATLNFFGRRQEKLDREAEKEQARQQELLDARMGVVGTRLGIEFANKHDAQIASGNIGNFQESMRYAQEYMHGLDPDQDQVAYNSMYAYMNQSLQAASTHFSNRDREELVKDNLLEIGKMQDAVWNNPAALNDGISFTRSIDSGLELSRQANITEHEYYELTASRGISKIEEAHKAGDSEKALLLRDQLLTSLEGKVVMDKNGRTLEQRILEADLAAAQANKVREQQEEENEKKKIVQQRDENYSLFAIEVAKANTPETIDVFHARLSGMDSRQRYEQFGPSAQGLEGMLNNHKVFVLYQKLPVGYEEAREEAARRFLQQDAQLIYEDGVLEREYGPRLLPSDITRLQGEREKIRSQQNPETAGIAFNALLKFQKDIGAGKTGYTPASSLLEDNPMEMGQQKLSPVGERVLSRMEAHINKAVNPADYTGEDGGDRLFSARYKAANEFLSRFSSGNDPEFSLHKLASTVNPDNPSITKDLFSMSATEGKETPSAYNALQNAVMPPRASPRVVKARIAQVKDPVLQEQLRADYASRIADTQATAVAASMTVSVEEEQQHIRDIALMQPPVLETTLADVVNDMKDAASYMMNDLKMSMHPKRGRITASAALSEIQRLDKVIANTNTQLESFRAQSGYAAGSQYEDDVIRNIERIEQQKEDFLPTLRRVAPDYYAQYEKNGFKEVTD